LWYNRHILQLLKKPAKLVPAFFFFSFFLSFTLPRENTIVWNAARPLTWDDFQGAPQKRFAAASTSYDILKRISATRSTTASVIVEAVFFTQRSWKKTEWINDGVLAHEQKHFDIVELFARKLRREINKLRPVTLKELESKVDSLYALNEKEMDIYQDRYDEETDGSMNGDGQRAWNKKISAEISALNTYSLTNLQIVFSDR
jgi:hypothetical protein